MKTLLRFHDLRQRGLCRSWAQLARLQKTAGFPRGRLLGPNTRTWTEDEVADWYQSRPTENARPLQGGAARKAARKAPE
jgi:predicted DNA-binding transcriptional regulator AlpA